MWKNRRIYLLIFIVTLYLTFFYNSYVLMLLTLTFLFFPFVTFLCAYITKKYISVKFYSETPIVKKRESFVIDLILENASVFPAARIRLSLNYKNHFAKAEQKNNYFISLNRRCIQKVMCEISSEYCGNVELKIEGIRLYDLLGLWSFKIPATHLLQVSVLPEMTEITEHMLRNGSESFLEEEEYSTKRSGDDPSEIFRIREYAGGDKMNRIHWKLSAKEGTLMVKDFGLPIDSSVVLLLELYSSEENTERYIDAVIEAVTALSLQFIRMKQLHFIAWFDVLSECLVRQRISGEEDLYESLAMLFESGTYQELYQAVAMYEARYRMEQYTNLFYVTSAIEIKDLYRVREFAKHSNCHITIIMDADEPTADEISCLKETDLTYSVVRPHMLGEDIFNMHFLT